MGNVEDEEVLECRMEEKDSGQKIAIK